MFEKLLAVVADERDQGAVGETQLLKLLQDSSDLGVHSSNRPVVPVMVVRDEFVLIDPGGGKLLAVWHPLTGQEPVGHLFAHRGQLLEVPFPLGGISPHGVVRWTWLERAVRVEHVHEGEERHVAVRLEPGDQAVDVLPGRFPPLVAGSRPASCTTSNP